ncbi:uncharacterized protein LOC131945168 [Physella acuta]|uniref:uncharacterized protein LOC131945168 n=1 Tax=Physella acuta TaxID=109671 RepID=UPI0027DE96E7|nr:uncharacterized protein LOC131945168 [Physella acuta]
MTIKYVIEIIIRLKMCLFITCLLLFGQSNPGNTECRLAKQGLIYNLTSNDISCSITTKVLWELNNQCLVECVLDKKCVSFRKNNDYQATFTKVNETYCQATFSMLVVSSEYEGKLSLYKQQDTPDNKHEVLYCSIDFYEKLKDITCSFAFQNLLLNIICTTLSSYREERRKMNIKYKEDPSTDVYSWNPCGNVMDQEKFRPVCSHSMLQKRIGIGLHVLIPTIYPNLSKYKHDEIYGDSGQFSLNVEQPSISLNCTTDENNEKWSSCVVQREDKSDVHTTITCYINDTQVDSKNEKQLFFNVLASDVQGLYWYRTLPSQDLIGTGPCRHRTLLVQDLAITRINWYRTLPSQDFIGTGPCHHRILLVQDLAITGLYWYRTLPSQDLIGTGPCHHRTLLVQDLAITGLYWYMTLPSQDFISTGPCHHRT